MSTRSHHGRSAVVFAVLFLVAVPAGTTILFGVDAEAATAPTPDLSVSGDNATGPAGGTVAVTYTVSNDGDNDSVAPVLRIDRLPPGWEVAGQESNEGTWRPDAGEWLWLRINSSTSRMVELTLAIPERANGTATIPVTLRGTDGQTADATTAVTVTEAEDPASDGGLARFYPDDSDAAGTGPDLLGIGIGVVLLSGIVLIGWVAKRRLG